MPTPGKPFKVLKSEKKSHRTKKELELREEGEKSLSSGVALKERSEVKSNNVAHLEFIRINELLKNIEKNDAIYEPVVNRYCLIQAECNELEKRREYFFKLIKELKKTFKDISNDMDVNGKATTLIEFTKELARLTSGMMNIDKLIQTKRKMLLDIEKENIMTIASALRSIPKKVDKEENPLLKALRDG